MPARNCGTIMIAALPSIAAGGLRGFRRTVIHIRIAQAAMQHQHRTGDPGCGWVQSAETYSGSVPFVPTASRASATSFTGR